MAVCSKPVVGIFSRDSDECYDWVIQLLLSPRFRRLIQDVRPVHITNEVCGGSWKLAAQINKCNIGILYHSQKRGRLNITDVTDSLYDQELRDLSSKLGRNNVLVLVDDVEDDDMTVHSRIISNQPSIRELSVLLVVFNRNEKPIQIGQPVQGMSGIDSYQSNVYQRSTEKIESIRSTISKNPNRNTCSLLLLIVFGGLALVLIIVLCVELIH